MPTVYRRLTAGLLTATALLTIPAAAALAGDVQAPWFQNVAVTPAAAFDPLGLAASYLPFWLYTDGAAWAEQYEWRMANAGLPAVYVARSATPLPGLPSQPAGPAAVSVPVASAAAPGTKPATPPGASSGPAAADASAHAAAHALVLGLEPVPAPAPEPTPAPAPEPTPAPAPEPTPAPAPEPTPASAPEPAPAPPSAPTGLTAAEQQMVSLVNTERTKAGLAPLTVDLRLVATARAKSRDMIDGGYFDHTSPRLGSPFDQMKAAGIIYHVAGENIAGNQTVAAAHEALMNSPSHRANILRPDFTKFGIGILPGGPYGLMVTQQFIGE